MRYRYLVLSSVSGANPALPFGRTVRRLGALYWSLLARRLALLSFGIRSVPSERSLVPRIAAAGAVGDILALMAKRILKF